MRGDIAKRIAIKIRSVRKLAYEPDDEPAHDPEPDCRGINDLGCEYDGTIDLDNKYELCHSCMSAVTAAAMEEFLPWDLMEDRAPDLYRQYDKMFSDVKKFVPQGRTGFVRNWTDYADVVQYHQNLATQIKDTIEHQPE